MALIPLTEPLGRKRAAHLLRRTCVGATISQIDQFANLTPQEALEQLFLDDLPDPVLPIDTETGAEWITNGPIEDVNSEDSTLESYLMRWNIAQMMSAGVPENQSLSYAFRERLMFFFHTHFTTKRSTVGNSRSIYYQNELFRFYTFDRDDIIVPPPDEFSEETIIPLNFKELAKKICVDNAMLRFLDGRLNVAGNPNENFARELLELYTIGRGLEGSLEEPDFEGDYIVYTEQDVQEGAKVLSGFNIDDSFSNIDEDTGLPRGVIRGGTIASSHDNSTKVFSFRLGEGVVSPDQELTQNGSPTEESLLDEISQLVDLIFDQNETARHICRKLYRFFVYHEISESLHDGIIQDMADIFIANDFKLYPVLEALFTSTHFYDEDAGSTDNKFGGIIKSPLDVVVGLARSFEYPIPDMLTQTEDYYETLGGMLGWMNSMGMDYFDPFEVAGYSGYHQFPLYYRSWITTNYLTNRYNFVRELMGDRPIPDDDQINLLNWVFANFPESTIQDGRLLITELASYLLPVSDDLSFDELDTSGEITPQRLNFYLQEFLFREGLGDPGEDAWTNMWPDNVNGDIVAERLAFLVNSMLQTPEYQLM